MIKVHAAHSHSLLVGILQMTHSYALARWLVYWLIRIADESFAIRCAMRVDHAYLVSWCILNYTLCVMYFGWFACVNVNKTFIEKSMKTILSPRCTMDCRRTQVHEQSQQPLGASTCRYEPVAESAFSSKSSYRGQSSTPAWCLQTWQSGRLLIFGCWYYITYRLIWYDTWIMYYLWVGSDAI